MANRLVQRVARDVTARGVRMRVVEAGEGNGPPVVLLHGFLSSYLSFDDVIEALAERFYVLAPDLPGFGASEKPNPSRYNYSVEAFSESVADLVAAYGIGQANIVGHGLGGAVALTLAAQHNELVQRIALVAPLCYAHPPNSKLRAGLWPIVGSAIFKQLYGRTVFRSYFKEEVFSSRNNIPFGRIDELYGSFNVPSARESAYAVLRAMLDTRSVVARVTRIRRPALVIWGRADRIYPASFATKLARELPNARLELLDAGHAPHEEHPDLFVGVVAEFFEGRR